MSIQELGSLGEFLAAIATLATLIYLALQIRNNTSVARAEAVREFTTSWNDLLSSMFDDKESSIVMRKGFMGDTESMDDDDILIKVKAKSGRSGHRGHSSNLAIRVPEGSSIDVATVSAERQPLAQWNT